MSFPLRREGTYHALSTTWALQLLRQHFYHNDEVMAWIGRVGPVGQIREGLQDQSIKDRNYSFPGSFDGFKILFSSYRESFFYHRILSEVQTFREDCRKAVQSVRDLDSKKAKLKLNLSITNLSPDREGTELLLPVEVCWKLIILP